MPKIDLSGLPAEKAIDLSSLPAAGKPNAFWEIARIATPQGVAQEILKTTPHIFKGLSAGTQTAIGQSFGSTLGAAGEKIQQSALVDRKYPPRLATIMEDVQREAFQHGQVFADVGHKFRDFFLRSAQNGWEAVDPEIMQAKLGQAGYGRKIAYQTGSAAPMMAAALAISAATKNPTLGASIFGPQAFGGFYDEARGEGKSVDTAIALGLADAVSQVGLESLPLTGWLKGGKLGTRVIRGILQEGLLEEGSQGVVENLLRKIGWGDPRSPFQDVLDSVIVGSIMGAGMGTIPSSNKARAKAKQQAREWITEEGVKRDLSQEAIADAIKAAENRIDEMIERGITEFTIEGPISEKTGLIHGVFISNKWNPAINPWGTFPTDIREKTLEHVRGVIDGLEIEAEDWRQVSLKWDDLPSAAQSAIASMVAEDLLQKKELMNEENIKTAVKGVLDRYHLFITDAKNQDFTSPDLQVYAGLSKEKRKLSEVAGELKSHGITPDQWIILGTRLKGQSIDVVNQVHETLTRLWNDSKAKLKEPPPITPPDVPPGNRPRPVRPFAGPPVKGGSGQQSISVDDWVSRQPLDPEYIRASVEAGGGQFKGMMGELAVFIDPETGTSLGMREGMVTKEAVEAKIAASRAMFKEAEKKVSTEKGESIVGIGTPVFIKKPLDIKDFFKKKVTLTEGDTYTPHFVANKKGTITKVFLTDGEDVILNKGQYQNLVNQNYEIKGEPVIRFSADEMAVVEEVQNEGEKNYAPEGSPFGEAPRWGEYALPGGENYRNIIWKFPEGKGVFGAGAWRISSHAFGSDNFGWARTKDFRDKKGRRHLMIVEIQRVSGKMGDEKFRVLPVLEPNQAVKNWEHMGLTDEDIAEFPEHAKGNKFFDFAMRKLIKRAVDEGYEGIVFQNAEDQKQYVGLGRETGEFPIVPGDRLLIKEVQTEWANSIYALIIDRRGHPYDTVAYFDERGLPMTHELNAIGIRGEKAAEIAKTIWEIGQEYTVSSQDMRESGKDVAKHLYEEELPNILKKYLGRYGGNLQTVELLVKSKDLAKLPSEINREVVLPLWHAYEEELSDLSDEEINSSLINKLKEEDFYVHRIGMLLSNQIKSMVGYGGQVTPLQARLDYQQKLLLEYKSTPAAERDEKMKVIQLSGPTLSIQGTPHYDDETNLDLAIIPEGEGAAKDVDEVMGEERHYGVMFAQPISRVLPDGTTIHLQGTYRIFNTKDDINVILKKEGQEVKISLGELVDLIGKSEANQWVTHKKRLPDDRGEFAFNRVWDIFRAPYAGDYIINDKFGTREAPLKLVLMMARAFPFRNQFVNWLAHKVNRPGQQNVIGPMQPTGPTSTVIAELTAHFYNSKVWTDLVADLAAQNIRPLYNIVRQVAMSHPSVAGLPNQAKGRVQQNALQARFDTLMRLLANAAQEIFATKDDPKSIQFTDVSLLQRHRRGGKRQLRNSFILINGIRITAEDFVQQFNLPLAPEEAGEAMGFVKEYLTLLNAFGIGYTPQQIAQWALARPEKAFWNLLTNPNVVGEMGDVLQQVLVWYKAEIETPLLIEQLNAGILDGAEMFENVTRGYFHRTYDFRDFQRDFAKGGKGKGSGNLERPRYPEARYRTYAEFVYETEKTELLPLPSFAAGAIEYMIESLTKLRQAMDLKLIASHRAPDLSGMIKGFENDKAVNALLKNNIRLVMYESHPVIRALSEHTGLEPNSILYQLSFVQDKEAPGLAVYYRGNFLDPYVYLPMAEAIRGMYEPRSPNARFQAAIAFTHNLQRFVTINPVDSVAIWLSPVLLDTIYRPWRIPYVLYRFGKALVQSPIVGWKQAHRNFDYLDKPKDPDAYKYIKAGLPVGNVVSYFRHFFNEEGGLGKYPEEQSDKEIVWDLIKTQGGFQTSIFSHFVSEELLDIAKYFKEKFQKENKWDDETAIKRAAKFISDTSFLLNRNIYSKTEGSIASTLMFTRNIFYGVNRIVSAGIIYKFAKGSDRLIEAFSGEKTDKVRTALFNYRPRGLMRVLNSSFHGETAMEDLDALSNYYAKHIFGIIAARYGIQAIAQFILSFKDDDERDEHQKLVDGTPYYGPADQLPWPERLFARKRFSIFNYDWMKHGIRFPFIDNNGQRPYVNAMPFREAEHLVRLAVSGFESAWNLAHHDDYENQIKIGGMNPVQYLSYKLSMIVNIGQALVTGTDPYTGEKIRREGLGPAENWHLMLSWMKENLTPLSVGLREEEKFHSPENKKDPWLERGYTAFNVFGGKARKAPNLGPGKTFEDLHKLTLRENSVFWQDVANDLRRSPATGIRAGRTLSSSGRAWVQHRRQEQAGIKAREKQLRRLPDVRNIRDRIKLSQGKIKTLSEEERKAKIQAFFNY